MATLYRQEPYVCQRDLPPICHPFHEKSFYHWRYFSSASDSPQLLAILLTAVTYTELLGLVMRLKDVEEDHQKK